MKVINILKQNESLAEFTGSNEVFWTPPTSANIYKDCKEYCIDIQYRNGQIVYADFWVGTSYNKKITDSEIKAMEMIIKEWVQKEADRQFALSKEEY
jgi:hypothetical protein